MISTLLMSLMFISQIISLTYCENHNFKYLAKFSMLHYPFIYYHVYAAYRRELDSAYFFFLL